MGQGPPDAGRGSRAQAWLLAITISMSGCLIPGVDDQSAFRTVQEQCEQSGVGHEVQIQATGFFPRDLTVGVRHCVVWKNLTNRTHTVGEVPLGDVPGPFDSQDIEPGATYTIWFDGAREFLYKCKYHSTMAGAVHVREGVSVTLTSGPATTTPPATTTTTTTPPPTTTTAPPTTTTTPPPTTSTPPPSTTTTPPPTTTTPPPTTTTTPPPTTTTTPPPTTTTPPPTTTTPPPTTTTEPVPTTSEPPPTTSEPPPTTTTEPPPPTTEPPTSSAPP